MRRVFRSAMALAGVLAAGGAAKAATVQLDMSSAFNFDAVGTPLEVTYGNANKVDNPRSADSADISGAVMDALAPSAAGGGNHAIPNAGSIGGRAYSSTALPVSGQYISGDRTYQLSTTWDDGTTGATKVNNSIYLNARTAGTVDYATGLTYTSTRSVTLTLTAAQQQKYSDINFVLVSNRGTTNAAYETWITAMYTDSTSVDIYDSDSTSGYTGVFYTTVGGTIGSGGIGTQGGFLNPTDTNPTLTNVSSSNTFLSYSGNINGGGTHVISAQITTDTSAPIDTVNLWRFTEALALDPTKTLQSITFNTYSSANSNNNLVIFAASATAAPEPASMALAALSGLGVLARRRRV